jgi:hypothetical protein
MYNNYNFSTSVTAGEYGLRTRGVRGRPQADRCVLGVRERANVRESRDIVLCEQRTLELRTCQVGVCAVMWAWRVSSTLDERM